MGKIKRMDQVRLILRTYHRCKSYKETARRLKMSKNTIKNYVKIIHELGLELEMVLALDEQAFALLFNKDLSSPEEAMEQYFSLKVSTWSKELSLPGVTRQLIWEEYRKDHPLGYSYSRFCAKLQRYLRSRDLTLALNHAPGDTLQIDFAGKKLSWVDPSTGEIIECEVLVTVCPFSHYCFVIALPSQKVTDFIFGINQALLFLGKLPSKILSDNLKSYVTTSDRYEPKFNALCVQLADHYNIELQATRPRKPKDKASVENAVRIACQRIYAPLRNEIFHSLEQLNQAIRNQLAIHNQIPFQKKEGCRKEIFVLF